jgi:hypothetical protein
MQVILIAFLFYGQVNSFFLWWNDSAVKAVVSCVMTLCYILEEPAASIFREDLSLVKMEALCSSMK